MSELKPCPFSEKSVKTSVMTGRHKPMHPDYPALTIRKQFARLPRERYIFDKNCDRIRKLTHHELAILQGFDNDYLKVKDISINNRIRAVGNAVPPPVAKAIGRAITTVADFDCQTNVELACGLGGLGLGIHQGTSFEPLLLADKWRPAVSILQQNRPEWPIHRYDLTKNRVQGYIKNYQDQVGILSGGLPCQPWSHARKDDERDENFKNVSNQTKHDDERDLMKYASTFVNLCKPEAFVFKNVPALAWESNRSYLKKILGSLVAEKYKVGFRIINSWNHSVAQKRKRLFIIGLHRDKSANVSNIFNYVNKHGSKSGKVISDVIDVDRKEIQDMWCEWPYPNPWE